MAKILKFNLYKENLSGDASEFLGFWILGFEIWGSLKLWKTVDNKKNAYLLGKTKISPITSKIHWKIWN